MHAIIFPFLNYMWSYVTLVLCKCDFNALENVLCQKGKLLSVSLYS